MTHGTAYAYKKGCRCEECRTHRNVMDRPKSKAAHRALQRLKKAHPDEFKNYYREEAEPLGVRVGKPGRPPNVETYCYNGHRNPERLAGGRCVECYKEKKRRRREKERGLLTRVPMEPLRRLILDRCKEHENLSEASFGYREVAARFAQRFEVSHETAKRYLQRILQSRAASIDYDAADRWCCALGVHMSALYGDETDEELAELYNLERRPLPQKPRKLKLDRPHTCKHCDYAAPTEHGLYLHSLSKHDDKTQGRHTWARMWPHLEVLT